MLVGQTGFRRDVLNVLDSGDGVLIGREVREELEGVGYELNTARLYTNLDRLVEDGLVNKSERDGRTNEYELTRVGSERLEAYREWITAGCVEGSR